MIPYANAFSNYCFVDLSLLSNERFLHDDRVSDTGALTDDHAGSDDRILHFPVDFRALADNTFLDAALSGNTYRRSLLASGIYFPETFVKVQIGICLDQIHVGFSVLLNAADFFPVTAELICADAPAFGKTIRDDILPKVEVLLFSQLSERCFQHFAVENVNPQVRHSPLNFIGIVRILLNNSVEIRRHHAVLLFPFGEGRSRDRDLRIQSLVEIEHDFVVHLVDLVSRNDKDIFRIVHLDKIKILINSIGRSRRRIGI